MLAFWQTASKDGYEGILRVFLCHLDADEHQCLRVERDVHSLPVNHTTVSFMRAIHLAYRCLGSRLFLLSFIECIAAKLAYLELSNVFTLTKDVWLVTYNEDTVTNDNKLMVRARFMLDDFIQCFLVMHTYTMVNQFSRFVSDYSLDSRHSSNVAAVAGGDYISHLECRHEKLEPRIGDQDFITPQRLTIEGSFSCSACSHHGDSPSSLINSKSIHMCKMIRDACYASRSFLVHYDVSSGTDHDVSQQELSLTLDNVSSFFFYPKPKKETISGCGGKDISMYREEAIRTLTDFMDSQLTKFEKDRPTSHHL